MDGGRHPDDRLVQSARAGGAVVGRAPETEHAAVGRNQPIVATVTLAGDADNRFVRDRRSRGVGALRDERRRDLGGLRADVVGVEADREACRLARTRHPDEFSSPGVARIRAGDDRPARSVPLHQRARVRTDGITVRRARARDASQIPVGEARRRPTHTVPVLHHGGRRTDVRAFGSDVTDGDTLRRARTRDARERDAGRRVRDDRPARAVPQLHRRPHGHAERRARTRHAGEAVVPGRVRIADERPALTIPLLDQRPRDLPADRHTERRARTRHSEQGVGPGVVRARDDRPALTIPCSINVLDDSGERAVCGEIPYEPTAVQFVSLVHETADR